MNIIGQAIDPTRIDQELVGGKPYWQIIPDIEYSIDGKKRKGSLLVAPALGFERAIVRTPEGKDFEMSPAYYSAEVLLDASFTMLTLRFFRNEIAPDGQNVQRRLVDAIPSPLIEDFIPRIKRLMEGAIRVVRPMPGGFGVLAAEVEKMKKGGKGAAGVKKTASRGKKTASKGKKAAAGTRGGCKTGSGRKAGACGGGKSRGGKSSAAAGKGTVKGSGKAAGKSHEKQTKKAVKGKAKAGAGKKPVKASRSGKTGRSGKAAGEKGGTGSRKSTARSRKKK